MTKKEVQEIKGHFDESTAAVKAHFDESTAEVRTHFDQRTAEAKTHLDERTAEVKAHFDESTAEVKTHFDERTAEVEAYFDERTVEVKTHVDQKTADTARLFGVVAEGLRTETRQVAEGVTLANQRIDGLAVQMDQMGRELRSEIRLVAGSQADLRGRVERLESKPTP